MNTGSTHHWRGQALPYSCLVGGVTRAADFKDVAGFDNRHFGASLLLQVFNELPSLRCSEIAQTTPTRAPLDLGFVQAGKKLLLFDLCGQQALGEPTTINRRQGPDGNSSGVQVDEPNGRRLLAHLGLYLHTLQ